MTDAQKRMKKYANEVERRLNLPKGVKARVMSDFSSSIVERREAGQSDEEIFAELGSPSKVAAELNEQMKEFACKRNPWRFAFLALAAWGILRLLSGLWGWLLVLLFQLHANFSPDHSVSIGIIGGADGPTAVFVTTPGWVHYMLPMLAAAAGILGYIKLKKSQ